MKRLILAAWACLALALPAYAATPVQAPAKPLAVRARRSFLTIPPPGQFAGKFEIVPLEQRCVKKKPTGEAFVAKCPTLKGGHQFYAVRNTYDFRTAAGDYVTVHGGTTTDLASTPKVMWGVLPPDGPGAKEFPVHDRCYASAGTFDVVDKGGRVIKVGRTRKAPYSRAECDEILRQAMVALRVPDWKRIAIFEGVRIGGGAGWKH